MQIQSNFVFPEEVKLLFNIFCETGDELRLVGGCIRNHLLNKKINDYDFATIYKTDEIINILKKNKIKYFETSIKYGTITAVINNINFEITTLRKDINQKGRDTDIAYVESYKEDASRRDFTINALYLDKNGIVYDYFDGLTDLKNNILKFIGDPLERILEDYLRILRLYRFFSYYTYDIDYKSLLACKKYGKLIENLSLERITEEFIKILLSNYCIRTLKLMQKDKVLNYILISSKKICFKNLEIFFSICNFLNFEYDYLFILALVFSKNNIIKCNLLFTKNNKKYIKNINDYSIKKISEFQIKKLLFFLKDKKFVKELIMIYFCNYFKNFKLIKNYFDFVDNFIIPDFKISGDDLLNYGFTDKKQFSILIEKCYEIYVYNNFSFDKDDVLKILKKENI